MKPTKEAVRLCHAVGTATRVRVNRWVAIDAALVHLAPLDQAGENVSLEAAIASGLVIVNPGPVAHSIALTAAGLDLCRAAGTSKV